MYGGVCTCQSVCTRGLNGFLFREFTYLSLSSHVLVKFFNLLMPHQVILRSIYRIGKYMTIQWTTETR